tara:strand:- start:350 stop:1072 length:723 start_codon:yes stop_codon:yes gene_type:complete
LQKNNPTFILIRPQLSENIGMTARAMDNFGFSKLSIVSPRDGWPNKKAESSAKHANNIIKKAKIYNSLDEAILNYDLVIATSNRKRYLTKKAYNNFNLLKQKINEFKKIAILFGPENSGLSNQDIRLANFLFTIPTHNLNKSLNLSHAVSIISYELFNLNNDPIKNIKTSKKDIVNKKELSNFMNFLIKDLDSNGFFLPKEKRESMIDNLYSIYNKFDLSKKELRMIWGVHKKLKKQPKL